MKIAILYNKVSENAADDESDVLDQVELVENNLIKLGHVVEHIQITLDMQSVKNELVDGNYDAVFNLTESIDNHGELITFGPALVDVLKIPYSGSSYEAIFLTTNKPVTKILLERYGILTPQIITPQNINTIDVNKRYIIKPIWEDGSLFLDEDCVVYGKELIERMKEIDFRYFFVEQYIDGREFNISILTRLSEEPQALKPAEIVFKNYSGNKPKIVGYSAKWEVESFEYKNTIREFPTLSKTLHNKLNKICVDCWKLFKLKGYARVDIRLDKNENPYVIEINANPCISPDSGFVAALKESGITETEAIERIIKDLNK
ncbi:MAG TPA: ATP-grasp domain-containing protein [Salinivirgaceae bacterium]|nr:ATP-grasp domain-containing protein [Salinivirgaceae bacterium]